MNSIEQDLDEILGQFIVFGQKQEPYVCARCGAQTDNKEQKYCWCTDRDTSPNYEPSFHDNINYPRYAEAKGKAKTALLSLIHRVEREARLKAASDIFSLAHEYASKDKTMIGSEELRSYHYFNAIHKIGEFDGR